MTRHLMTDAENSRTCFVNVSFTPRYVATQHRLRESILKHHPDANLLFWTDEMPPGARSHQESCYGFKVHAIQYATDQGYTRIVWIDTCAVLNKPIEPLFTLAASNNGFFVIQDDNKLYRYTGQWFKKMYSINPEWRLLGGSIYIFDFTQKKATELFDLWGKMELLDLFGSQAQIYAEKNDGVDNCGHRQDETCLAYCMYCMGMKPFDPTTGMYNQNEDSIILKQHFLKDGEKWYDQKL